MATRLETALEELRDTIRTETTLAALECPIGETERHKHSTNPRIVFVPQGGRLSPPVKGNPTKGKRTVLDAIHEVECYVKGRTDEESEALHFALLAVCERCKDGIILGGFRILQEQAGRGSLVQTRFTRQQTIQLRIPVDAKPPILSAASPSVDNTGGLTATVNTTAITDDYT